MVFPPINQTQNSTQALLSSPSYNIQKIFVSSQKIRTMGNEQIPSKQDLNPSVFEANSSSFQPNDLQEKNMSYEYQQPQNPLINVFQKEISKKSKNQLTHQHHKTSQLLTELSNSKRSFRKPKAKTMVTQTLFHKEKITKIANKVIEEQSMNSCDSFRLDQHKQNIQRSSIPQETTFFKPIIINQEKILKIKKTKIDMSYQLLETIGQGSFGVVYKALCLTTQEYRAIKVLPLHQYNSYERKLILNEISILFKLDHPNIIKTYEIYEYDSTYYLITQYCDGGSFSEYLKSEKPHHLQQFTKKIMRKLLSAVQYIHSKHIIHRDIKLQNIVFKKLVINGQEDILIKIIDFGLAVQCEEKEIVRTEKVIGTPQYLAPENIMGIHTLKSDIWCCGIIMYAILKGNTPFRASTKSEVLIKIQRESVNLKNYDLHHFSKEAKDLMGKMLAKHYENRPNASECLQHHWFEDFIKKQRAHLTVICDQRHKIAQDLQHFQKHDNLITFLDSYTIFTKFSQSQREKLILYFNLIDHNQDGVISLNQLKAYFKTSNFPASEAEISTILKKLDLNNSQTIYLNEFIYALSDLQKYYESDYLKELFALFDKNNDGYIDKHELKGILHDSTNEQLDFYMKTIPSAMQKKISFADFKHHIKSQNRRKSSFSHQLSS